MKLIGERLYLRPVELSDADGEYPHWLNDPDVCRYNSHGESDYTRAMALDYIRNVTDNPSIEVFAICLKESDRHIGNISLQQISRSNHNAELAILIGDTGIYGQGIGREACMLLLAYAFDTLGLHRVYCGTHGENIAMQHVALSIGMSEEGRRRDAIFKNGKFADVIEYGILKDDSRGCR